MPAVSVSQESLEAVVDEILQGTACTLSHIRDVNDWKDAKPPSMSFVGRDVPDLPVLEYCQRLHKYFRCSPTVYLAALIYIDRMIQNSDVTINKLTIHRLLIVSFVISVKYWEDLHYSNQYYSQVGGVGLQELNKLESKMLNDIKYDLHIDEAQFQHYYAELAMHPELCTTCRGEDIPDLTGQEEPKEECAGLCDTKLCDKEKHQYQDKPNKEISESNKFCQVDWGNAFTPLVTN
jgi:hypothetical protein